MKNKTVKLVLSIIVLGVLVGGYFGVKAYVAGQEAKEAEAEQEEEETSVLETEESSITSLKFVIDKQEVTFVKEDNLWVKEDEKDFPVDQSTLDSAASYISSVTAERILEDVEDLSEYGLDSPSNTITVKTDDDTETVIRVGIKNESTSQYYLRKDDDKTTVYVVSAATINPFMNTLYDYAEMGEFPTIDSSTVSRVNVEQKDSSYEAVKEEDSGLWDINSAGIEAERADTTSMNSIASALSTFAYDSFVDYNCTDEEKYGFDDPYAVVTVDYQEEVEVEAEDADADDITDDDIGDTENVDADDTTDDDIGDAEEVDADDTEDVDVGDAEDADIDDTADTDSDNVEGDDLDTDDTAASDTDESDTSEEPETEMVDRELVLYIGDICDSDYRYVMIEGSAEVYTITNDVLSTVIDKDASSLLNMTVNYLSLNDLDSLDVELDGERNTIDVSHETFVVEDEEEDDEDSAGNNSAGDTENDENDAESSSEDESEPETETVVTYELNGNLLEDIKFSSFYNKLINLIGQKRLTEEYNPEDEAEMAVVFHNLEGESVNVDFYVYDVNYYAAVVDNSKVYLINKMTFRELRNSFAELLADEEENSGENVENVDSSEAIDVDRDMGIEE